jgi:hypothetical protein
MSLFERFTDTKEDGFREEFIKPLLVRSGFVGISNQHGRQEFGKDYVFSEIDAFGQFRHLVVQAKHLEKIGQGKGVDDLVSQIEQCFYVEYTLPFAPTEKRFVSAVYVFNSGEITDNAETQIRSRLKKEFAANVRCFGGHHLEILASAAAQRQDRFIRERLQGLIAQLNMNVHVWESMSSGLKAEYNDTVWEGRGPILHALEEFLSCPILPSRIPYSTLSYIWQRARIIDAIVKKNISRELTPRPEPYARDCELLKALCADAVQQANALAKVAEQTLAELPSPII